MSRPVSIRVSYRDDAAYLIRLEAAVEKDDSQSKDWRQETALMLRKLSLRFLEADGSRNKAKKAEVVARGVGSGKGPSTAGIGK
jgi:hypothetical protein